MVCFTGNLSLKSIWYILLCWNFWQSKTVVICLKLRPKLCVWRFLCVFKTFSHKVVQTWFVWKETWHTTLFGICYCIEIVRIQNNIQTLEITCKDAFLRFLSVFGTFSHKMVQPWFFWHKTWHITLFGTYYCVELLESKTIVICLKLRAKLRVCGLSSVFGTFTYKKVQTLFGFHETSY